MTNFEQKLTANIWKYTLILIANKRVYVAILGAYYLTVPDIAAKEIGLILLAGNLAGFIFEIPSGYAADKFGHKNTIILSRLIMLCSSIMLLLSSDLVTLCIASVLISLGFAFFSGTGSAFMHETLRDLGRDGEYTSIMGKASSIGFAIPAVMMALVPFLVAYDIKAPFVVALVIDTIGVWASLALVSPRVEAVQVEEIRKTNFKQVLQIGYNSGFLRFALFSGLTTGVLMAVSSFRAVYQSELGIQIIYFGLFFGAGRVLASVLLAYSGKLKKFFSVKSFYLFQFFIYIFMIGALGFTNNAWLVVALFLVSNAFNHGLSQIEGGYMLETIKDSKFKATLLSVASQIGALFSAAMCFGIGMAISSFSYQGGFLLMTLVYILLGLPLLMYLFKYKKDPA